MDNRSLFTCDKGDDEVQNNKQQTGYDSGIP